MALQANLQDRFEQRVAARLEAVFPEQMARVKSTGAGDAPVIEFVRSVLKRAEALGLERERDLVGLIVVFVTNAELERKDVGFYAWARPLLDRSDTPGHMKFAMVVQRLEAMRARSPIASRVCQCLEAACAGF